jgi:hypothetical protein
MNGRHRDSEDQGDGEGSTVHNALPRGEGIKLLPTAPPSPPARRAGHPRR